ncbi:hypothetical protein DB32_002114 [Sandaracinus amylolyticus]|uniref:Uncharacterized protein n=1 Tax=Sandaracinus amylolyticus TaxID=927083 RepID=A0A0F6W1N2_9BACT|nr:hypothetical protein DB32_002114 [Sandaracinus amylolyticus]
MHRGFETPARVSRFPPWPSATAAARVSAGVLLSWRARRKGHTG